MQPRSHAPYTDAQRALVRSLGLPVDALRASIEALEKSFGEPDPRGDVLRRAVLELRRLGRRVEELVDLSDPAALAPLRCTAEEIVCSVRDQLLERERARLVLAWTADLEALWVDGPLLARALRRVVENALEASVEDVLLSARQERDRAVFAVVDNDPRGELDPATCQRPFHSDKTEQLGLGWTLAVRDVERMGGTLEAGRTGRGETCVLIRIPCRQRAHENIEEVAA